MTKPADRRANLKAKPKNENFGKQDYQSDFPELGGKPSKQYTAVNKPTYTNTEPPKKPEKRPSVVKDK